MQHSLFHKIWLLCGLFCLLAGKMAAQPNWSLNPAEYQFSMLITAQLNIGGTPDHAPGNIVAVYVGDELRGVALPVVVSGQAFYFLTVYAHTYATDTLTFKAYIAAANAIYTSPDSVAFKHNTHLGKISAPRQLHFGPSEAPQIYSSNQIFFQENTCLELHDVQSLDNEDSEGNGLIYSLNGGADAGKFSIHSVTGKLEWFNFAPDFEAPADTNGDSVYEVKIKVTDQEGYFSEQNLRVAVTDNAAENFDPQISGNLVLCSGEFSTLQVSEGVQFLWNTGATSAVLTDVTPGAYSVTVTNAGACTAARSANVQSNEVNGGNVGSNQVLCPGSNDPAPFTSVIAGTGTGELTYRWELGSGGCGGGFSPIANAVDEAYDAPPGLVQTTYFRRVAVSTLNGYVCETPSNCLTVGVLEVDNEPPVALCKNISISLDASGNASITASQIDNGSSDNCALGVLTVTPNTFNTSNLGSNTVTLNVSDLGGNASTCTATVTVTPYSFSISGTIFWEHDDVTGVGNATVALMGNQSGSVITPAAGTYSFTLNSGSNFTVTPTKTINKLNGVTTADATRIQQHVANNLPLSDPYKIVAADVNKSNSVTSQDASIVNQALLGNPAALAQFKTSWRFVPTSHTMANPPWGFPENIALNNVQGNVPGQNFFGIKTGDVLTPFTNPANFNNPEASAFVLNVPDQSLQLGEQVSIAFSANQFSDLAALQFALKFDTEKLALTEITPLAGLPFSEENFGVYNVSEGEIRIVWSQAEGVFVEEAALAFQLTFNVLKTGGTFSQALQLAEEVLENHAYTSALEDIEVKLHFFSATGANVPTATNGLYLFQNRPNPFNGQTSIGFVLPESCEAQLRVFDVSGRVLAEKKAQYPAGWNEETFDWQGASGVLWYELTTPFGVLAKKMVAVKK